MDENASVRRDESGRPPRTELAGAARICLIGLFLIACLAVLYFAQGFLVPVALAFLLALVLSPLVRFLARRRIPPPVTAVALVLTLLGTVAAGVYFLSGPVQEWVNNAPQIEWRIRQRLAEVREPVEAMRAATERVDRLTQGDADARTPEVVVREPGLLARTAATLPNAATGLVFTLVLLLFLLASGDLFYAKLVRVLPTFRDKKRALRIAHDVEQEVSRYLSTIFFINVGLGVWMGFGMWLIGLPNPALWGTMAFMLNFIPYLGAFIGTVVVGLVGVVTFDDLAWALLPPAFYVLSNTLEGHILTPSIVGRRLDMNAVVVFLSVAFWAWMWGIVGAVMAVPMLVLLKVLTQHVEALAPVGEFLADRHSPEEEDEKEKAPSAA
ncbi:AI-2E family transporter [Crenalkalicoccus roseus]|uniref:AI-2E family transporter n=1 Tax=Crenalkalicoccus roseus TaxID=1485588 RepID=UPI00130528E4|nr:AI-2E family transporter [Crenalkalicoccus roseus]